MQPSSSALEGMQRLQGHPDDQADEEKLANETQDANRATTRG